MPSHFVPESMKSKDKRTAESKVKMQHRHFAFIAQTISTIPDTTTKSMVAFMFRCACKANNPRFDPDRFYAACGIDPIKL